MDHAGVLYFALLMSLGLMTLRKGHTALFWFGIIFPVLWIIGAIITPTLEVSAAEARASLGSSTQRQETAR